MNDWTLPPYKFDDKDPSKRGPGPSPAAPAQPHDPWASEPPLKDPFKLSDSPPPPSSAPPPPPPEEPFRADLKHHAAKKKARKWGWIWGTLLVSFLIGVLAVGGGAMTPRKPFWETKTLSELTVPEWESLCDGCGLCCLVRFEDEDTGEIIPTRVHCQLFDEHRCQCKDYPNRKKTVPDCIKLTPYNIEDLEWMPPSCAYRRLHEGKDLPRWHPLVTGDPDSTHKAGVSIRDQTVSELSFVDAEDAMDFVATDLMRDRGDDLYEPDEED